MRRALILPLLLTALPLHAEIRSVEECGTAIAADPERAREDAAVWARSGGGLPARLCEASALEEMGATATAARLLTGLAENSNRAMEPALRAMLFEDAARLWLDEARPDLARIAFDNAERLSNAGWYRLTLGARIAAAQDDWPAARDMLARAIGAGADSAEVHAMHAAALRKSGDLPAARAAADLALSRDKTSAAARFEAGAAAAELQETTRARSHWLALIRANPEHDLAGAARRNLQALN